MLSWQEEAAPIQKQLRIHKRAPMPSEQEVLDRRPPHHDAAAIIVECWHDLSTERALSLGYGVAVMGMIPWSKVMAWCRQHGLDADNTLLVWTVIRELDAKRADREASQRALNGGG